MGTVYTFMASGRSCVFIFLLSLCFTANATTHTITIGNTGFSPFTTNADVGDTILWTWQAGTHTTTSGSVPTGAATWNAPLSSSSSSFMYVITLPGTYNYFCSVHVNMTGIINVAGSGIQPLSPLQDITAYPQPCTSQLTVDFSNAELGAGTLSVQLANAEGQVLYNRNVEAGAKNLFIDVANLPTGIYYCAVTAGETRRLLRVFKGQ